MNKIALLLALFLPVAAMADQHLEIQDWENSWHWNVGLMASEEDRIGGGSDTNRGWTTCVAGDKYNYEHKFTIGLEGCLLISPGESGISASGGSINDVTIIKHRNGKIKEIIIDGEGFDVDGYDNGYNALTGAATASYPLVWRTSIIGQYGLAFTDYDDGRTENDPFWAIGLGRSFGALQVRGLYRDFDSDTNRNTLGVDFGVAF